MVVQEVHSALKAFDPFLQLDTGNEILHNTVRMRLTQALGTSQSRLYRTLLMSFS
jgi:hypothetical protein